MFLLDYLDHTIKKIKSQSANALTLLNLSLGSFAILFILRDELKLSLLLIFLAALADRFDGMVARKLNIESELGKQLDSMCDIISFGIAPLYYYIKAFYLATELQGLYSPLYILHAVL